MEGRESTTGNYDFLIAGGGLAGLCLAWQIVQSPLRSRSILIVDHDPRPMCNSTYSFWSDRVDPFQHLVSGTWDQLSFYTSESSLTSRLGRYRYHTIRGADIFRFVSQELAACPPVTFLQGHISDLQERPDAVVMTVDGRQYTGEWAFDSRFRAEPALAQTQEYRSLKMSFYGWDIETEHNVFNPETATLMDFRTYQGVDMRFFYVLPYDRNHALVEYTLFAQRLASRPAAEAALYSYLEAVYNLRAGSNCQIEHREAGSLLVTDRPFERRSGRRILAIGLPGGRLKPSTGYAYTRIQRDSRAILRSLQKYNHPFLVAGHTPLYPLLDSLMLEVMRDYPEQIPGIFTALFKKNSMEAVLRFLDEDASMAEVQRLMASLPAGLFLKLLGRRGLKLRPNGGLTLGSFYSQGNRS